MTRWID
jgi:hypothetical protein